MNYDMIKAFGLDPTGETDCAPGLAKAAAAAKLGDRFVFPAGTYSFSAWPAFTAHRLQFITDRRVVLRHTGSGDAVTFDGGATTGMYGLQFEGFALVPGPQTQNGLVLKSVHHSKIEATVHGCGDGCSAVLVLFSVCTELRPGVSINEASIDGYPIANAAKITGVTLDAYPGAANLRTTACVIRQPILEGLNQGIVFAAADSNTVDGAGGTIEQGNYGIVFPDGDYAPGNNRVSAIEMEANATADVYFGTGSHNNRVEVNNASINVGDAAPSLKHPLPNNHVHCLGDIL